MSKLLQVCQKKKKTRVGENVLISFEFSPEMYLCHANGKHKLSWHALCKL